MHLHDVDVHNIMKINLNQLEEDFNIDVDDYLKFIITHRCYESIDECEPVSYEIKDGNLYIPNNFILLMFHARPARLVEQPPKIIIGAYTNGDYTATTKLCLSAFKNKDEVWRAIKNALQDMDAKYPEKVTRELIRHIIGELPLEITKGFVEEDSLAKKFDRVDFEH